MTLKDIQDQLSALFSGGQYQGDGATTFAAPTTSAPNVVGSSATFAPNFGGGVAQSAGTTGLGANLPTAGLAIGGLNSLTGFIQGNRAQKAAKDQFKFQKELANINVNNAIKSYNTTLEDRLNARGAQQGDDPTLTASNIERNRLTR